MHYKWLGGTGIQVSALCYGTMSFGGDADKAESARMYRACREAGINFFDCADVYNNGLSEEILGEFIANERDQLVITSKCFGATGDDINARGSNRRHISSAVEASLKRLNTDRLDILFMHQWDHNTPIEETLRGLEDVVRSGKVLYLGASNYAAWQVAKSLGISARQGWSRFEVLQPMYNLVKRQVETEILPLVKSEQLGVISYSPVGGGLLSGKYGPETRPNSGRLINNPMYTSRYSETWVFETARQFTELARRYNHHPVSLAVAWVAANTAITSPIIGSRSLEQLQPSLTALDIAMTDDLYAEISALSPTPPPATDRSEER